VLHSAFFRFHSGVKPHPKLKGSASGLEADLFFPGRDNTHTEREYLLKPRTSTTTFTALAPELDAAKIQALIDDKKAGVFNVIGCWLGETPTVRRYQFSG
jgi:hypothetical protein